MTETLTTEQVEAIVEWQDISTAPKDGTRVLVFEGTYGMAVAGYDSYWQWVERGADYATEVWGNGTIEPTHWKPLPTPPPPAPKEPS